MKLIIMRKLFLKPFITIILFLFSHNIILANYEPVYCTCTTSDYYLIEGDMNVYYYDIVWTFMASGSCSGASYNFGSSSVYIGGYLVNYTYYSNGFTNPCYQNI